jgi:hypothetical protein
VLKRERKLAILSILSVDVVVANEPLAYREVLAATLREIRPHVEMVVVEPDELDLATALHEPRLVVCSQLTDAIERGSGAWALLYPGGATWSELSFAGNRTRYSHVDLVQLLAFVDQAVIDDGV